jgi:hypothetical protein
VALPVAMPAQILGGLRVQVLKVMNEEIREKWE